MLTDSYFPTLVTRFEEIEQIAALSNDNLRYQLSAEEKKEQGFITWQYTTDLLQQMHTIAPSVIIKYNDQVVAYALTAFKETASFHPDLKAMVDHLDSLLYNNKALKEYSYYAMGQICIHKAHRGKGLVERLYQQHKTVYAPKFELLITEISTSNLRSLKAHRKTGFHTIYTYRDAIDEWEVVAWDWQ